MIEPSWGIGAADERMNVWLATHRTPSRTEASLVGSIIAGGVVLPIVAGSLAIVFAALRRWRIAAFFAFALAVESATYRATTLAVHSHRPRVARLESLPVNASYPSGHTAASLAVYGGIVLLLTSRITRTSVRSLAWLLALSIVAFVAMARMYRGMHHSLDVGGGVFVGVAALTVIVFACRAAGAAAELRDGGHAHSWPIVKVAVIAHSGKTLGGGLPELRRVLETAGVEDPFWAEVPKSRKAPAQVRRALDKGAELIIAWGGDGMVQRCIDVLAGTGVSLAIIPAGTANLFATNLGIPKDIEQAVEVGLHGDTP